jgi:hypothetical protein
VDPLVRWAPSTAAASTRLIEFVQEHIEELGDDPDFFATSVIRWLALAERLQLDELCEVCLGRLRGMPKQLMATITVEVEEGSGADKHTRRVLSTQVEALGRHLTGELLLLAASALAL